MSNRASTLVWDHAHYTGTRKLVLLALADAANQEGLCWPSMKTIARMAGCSERRAQEHIGVLEEAGWIERIPQPGRANWYRVKEPPTAAETPAEPMQDITDDTETEGCEISHPEP